MGAKEALIIAAAAATGGYAALAYGTVYGVGAAGATYMGGKALLDKPKLPGVQPLPPSPSGQSKEVQDAELAERDRLRRARGRSSTILTGNTNMGAAPTQIKTLLGGN